MSRAVKPEAIGVCIECWKRAPADFWDKQTRFGRHRHARCSICGQKAEDLNVCEYRQFMKTIGELLTPSQRAMLSALPLQRYRSNDNPS